MGLWAIALVFGMLQAPATVSEPASVPVTFEFGLLFLEVERTGEKPLFALLDTGASASAIDLARSGELPVLEHSDVVGTTGTLAVETVRIDGLHIGDTPLPVLRSTRRDLSGLLAPNGRKVDLILGSDALAGRCVIIDFTSLRLQLVRGGEKGAPGVPMTLDNGIPTLPATLDGIGTRLRIDTGASLFDSKDVYVNIPAPLWQALRRGHPALTPVTAFQGTGANGRAVDLPVAAIADSRIGTLDLARLFVIVQPEVGYFAEPDAMGFVSNNFLRKLGRVTLDYGAGRFRSGP
jgi:hypothetical protein